MHMTFTATLGIFLGASLITVTKIVELIMTMLYFLIQKLFVKKKINAMAERP